MYIFGRSYVSLTGAILLLIISISFVPSKVPWKKKVVIGILHVSAHLAAAVILMLLMELGIETCIRHKLLATSGEILHFMFYYVIVFECVFPSFRLEPFDMINLRAEDFHSFKMIR